MNSRKTTGLLIAALAWGGGSLQGAPTPPTPPPTPPPPTSVRVNYSDRTGYWLEIGKATAVPLWIYNQDKERVDDLRLKIDTDAKWLDVKMTGDCQPLGAVSNVWKVPEIPAAGEHKELNVQVTIRAETGGTADSTGKSVGASKTRARDQATLMFTVWRESLVSADTNRPASSTAPVLYRQSWHAKYVIRAATPELGISPEPMEWHLVSAQCGELRPLQIKIKNLNVNEPLKNVTAFPISDQWYVALDSKKAGNLSGAAETVGLGSWVPDETKPDVKSTAAMEGIPGLNVIAPNAEGTFTVNLRVDTNAQSGSTATVALDVRTTTLGTLPNPWRPFVLLQVKSAPYELLGNFEAYLYYNLPPSGPDVKPGDPSDPARWIPLPKGTKVTVSQVYTMRGGEGMQKYVEQFVGYGNVIDEKGYVCCKIDPEPEPNMRLRIVADTIANEIQLKYKADTKEKIVESYKVLKPRCAVTPFGKRTYRNISHTFLARLEEQPSSVRKGKALKFYTPVDDQDFHFIKGNRILIPYYKYESFVDKKAKDGIPINWEGELSTGGAINFFQDPGSWVSDLASLKNNAFWDSGSGGQSVQAEYNQQLLMGTEIGLIYHNHNELFAVLSALVQAQEFLADLPFFRVGEKGRERELPAVIAYWHRGQGVPNGETGYACMPDGTWRLVVQNVPEDPDERDLALVLRGYGAAIRHYFFKPPAQADQNAKPPPPNYAYYRRTNMARAWEEGFDIFFAASVLNKPKALNEFVGPNNDAAKKNRSVDLDDVLATAAQAQGPAMYDEKFHNVRGADNSVAVAAGLWAAGRQVSPAGVIDNILSAQGGSLPAFLTWVRRQDASQLRPLVQLGLCPRVDSWPPGYLLDNKVDLNKVEFIWDPNDALPPGKISGALRLGSDAAAPAVMELKSPDKKPVIINLGKLPDGKQGNALLTATRRIRGMMLWTIETKYGKDETFLWPLQSFLAASPAASLANGANIPLANGGSINAPSIPGQATVQRQRVDSMFDGRKVLGGEVYQVGYFESDEDEEVKDFPEPVDLTLGWGEKEEVGQATPGIYFFDPDAGKWELVGTTPAGDRKVTAKVTRAGAYALMIDQQPPQFENLRAGPNPFMNRLPGVAWRLEATLSEPAWISFRILASNQAPVRTLAEKQACELGLVEFAWDGKDAQGRPATDGTYQYEVLAWDESGLGAEPVTGRIAVFNGEFGSVTGRVLKSLNNAEQPEVALQGFNVSTYADGQGQYWLAAVPPGAYELSFRCAGHFDEVRPVQLANQGEDVRLPDVQLAHLAMGKVEQSSPIFTPNGDGTNDFVSFQYDLNRPCEYEVTLWNEEGDLARTLRERQAAPAGREALAWNGEGDDRELLPSGWYRARWIAFNREESLPQTESKVLLDRGLIQYSAALPYLFSPNDDGFDDVVQFGFNLEREADVHLSILGLDGSLLFPVTNAPQLSAGWHTLEWNGRGRGGLVVPDGKYLYELAPVYPGGFTSMIVRGEFQLDSRPPEIGEVTPENGAVIRTGMPRISAKILSRLDDIDSDQLKIKIDENTVEADEIDLKQGVFAYTPKTSLGPGVHIAIAYAQDWAGNYAPPQAVSFTITFDEDSTKPFLDKKPPEILSLEPSKNSIVYGATPLITAKVRDLGTGIDPNNITLFINGERQANSVQRFIPGKSGKAWDWYSYEKAMVLYDPLEGDIRYVPITPLPEGKNVVSLEVWDKVGNRSAKAESVFQVIIDREPPSVEILQPKNGAVLAQSPSVLVAKISETGRSGVNTNTFQWMLDGRAMPPPPDGFAYDAQTGVLRIPLSEPLARDMQHMVAVSVRDRAGNLSRSAIAAFTLVEDGDPPRVDLLLPLDRARYSAGAPVRLAAAVYDIGRGGLDETSLAVTLNGDPIPPYDFKTGKPGYILSQGLVSHTFEALKPGHYVLEIRCRDKAGTTAAPAIGAFDVTQE